MHVLAFIGVAVAWGCSSQGQDNSKVAGLSSGAISDFSDYQSLLNSVEFKSKALSTGGMSISDYTDSLHYDAATYQIGGVSLPNMQPLARASMAGIDLGKMNVADYWKAVGVSATESISLADFQAGLAVYRRAAAVTDNNALAKFSKSDVTMAAKAQIVSLALSLRSDAKKSPANPQANLALLDFLTPFTSPLYLLGLTSSDHTCIVNEYGEDSIKNRFRNTIVSPDCL